MPSSFTWLDYSERERRQAQQVISLFREQDTRDELGLAGIRDTLADLFFPGTTTIQTRARYFLFAPWLYQSLEAREFSSARIGERMRSDELAMIQTLLDGGEYAGVIGAVAGRSLQRTPSSIYWFGLGAWGIRLFDGSQEQYHASLDSYYQRKRRARRADDGESFDAPLANWHQGLPALPPDFPKGLTFRLSRTEAHYLRERIMLSNGDSLLAFLVDRGRRTSKIPFVWEHPQYNEFPERIREQLVQARAFSEIMHGAALLYNLMLAEKAPGKMAMLVDAYRDRLTAWADSIRQREAVHRGWNLDDFWDLLLRRGLRVPIATRAFVSSWIALAVNGDPHAIPADKDARRLIHEREVALKRNRARLVNQRSLELWSGASGSAQLNYRWQGADIILDDILEGLTREDADA